MMSSKLTGNLKTVASDASTTAVMLQRKCDCGNHTMSGECDECAKKKGTLQRKASNNTESSAVPSIVHEVLRSSGEPLHPSTRAFMEPRFGYDFSNVRVHTDARAAESASAVGARAFTVGNHIVFRNGDYSPDTEIGRTLLAHEMTHVVQQTGGLQRSSITAGPKIVLGSEDNELEREADEVAKKISGNGQVQLLQGADSTRLQRQPVFRHQPAFVGLDDAGPKAQFVGGTREAELMQCIKTRGADPEECDPKLPLTWTDFQGTPDPASGFGAMTGSRVNPVDVPTQVCAQLVLGRTTGATRRFRAKLNSSSSWALDSVKSPADPAKNGCAPLVTQCENHFNGGGSGKWGLRPAGNCAASVPFRGDTASSAPECVTKVGADCKDQKIAESARLLKHEQGHFDISCVFARKANAALAQGLPERTIHTAVIAKRSPTQTTYDTETSHGCVAAKQASWETDIAGGLNNITIP